MDYVIALVPPAGLFVILVVIVRAFLGADRSERAAEKKFREEHPDLDLAPLPPNRSTVAGALAAEEARRARGTSTKATVEPGDGGGPEAQGDGGGPERPGGGGGPEAHGDEPRG